MNKTYLVHYGIKGQRWGIRRFQNEDGSLTPLGEKRYGDVDNMNRTRSRNKKIVIGVGVTSATIGAAVLINKNRKLKKELSGHKDKEAIRAVRNAKAKATRLANIASGKIPPPKYKIPPGSDVAIRGLTKKGENFYLEMIKVAGGFVVKGGGG